MNGDPLLTGDDTIFPSVNSSAVPTVWEEDMVQAAEGGIGCKAGPMLTLRKISTPDQYVGGALNPCPEPVPNGPPAETLFVQNVMGLPGGLRREVAEAHIAFGTAGGAFIGGAPRSLDLPPAPGPGVMAFGAPGIGVFGSSTSGAFGVQGSSAGQAVRGDGGRFGVVGNGTATGVDGTGTFGVVGKGTATNVDGQGSPIGSASFGVVGVGSAVSVWAGDGTRGTGGIGVFAVPGPNFTSGGITFTPWAGRFDGPVWVHTAGGAIGDLTVDGSLLVLGATKASVVPHPDGSRRVMHCMEAPESCFEDIGRAQLREAVARVDIDPDFAAVSGLGDDYHVFLTAEGPSNGLYVSDRTSTGFEVREQGEGTSDISFSYRIVTKRADKRSRRLEPIELPSAAGEAAGEAAGTEAEPPPPAVPASPEQPDGAPAAGSLPEGAIPERPPGWPETVPWPPDILVNHLRR
jgi:hypothetical protein